MLLIKELKKIILELVKITQKFSNFQEEKFQKLIENDNEIQFLKRDVMDFIKKFPIDDVKY
jgi:hypothetical protein